MNNFSNPSNIDFWMDYKQYSDYIIKDISKMGEVDSFSIDLIRLVSIRKSISNFVSILTRKSIPVYFKSSGNNFNVEGKQIYISSEIKSKYDFDVTVGLALHEASHTLLTNFDVVKTIWANIPKKILTLSDSKNIRRSTLEKFIHTIYNVIEDRFVDNFIYYSAPGYRGYYKSLYDKYFNSERVSELLKQNLYTYPSLSSYKFRIINLTNENSTLDCLPNFKEIVDIIDLPTISRLTNTTKRVDTAFKVVQLVLEGIYSESSSKKINISVGSKSGKDKENNLPDPNDYFDFEDDSDVGTKMVKEISDVIGGKNSNPKKLDENEDVVNKISEYPIDTELIKEISQVEKKQNKFLFGEIDKKEVSESKKDLFDLIEKTGIQIVSIPVRNGNDVCFNTQCIVVTNLTRELVFSGPDIFPLSSTIEMGNPPQNTPTGEAVKKGISIGTRLGRLLHVRNESNTAREIRRKYGKIDKRSLYRVVCDDEDIFSRLNVMFHSDASLHISIDASGSMQLGGKWQRTMTSVVAICKSASMVGNIHVTVSFRCSINSGKNHVPYIVMAYDSRKDSFSKIRNLFPHLSPNGGTPEGLAFAAILKLFKLNSLEGKEKYFVNISDGQPDFPLVVPTTNEIFHYCGDVAVHHTHSQVEKIRRNDIQILSYFIDINKNFLSNEKNVENVNNFKKMYGKNSKFIDMENVLQLAKTMNELFLHKIDQKSS